MAPALTETSGTLVYHNNQTSYGHREGVHSYRSTAPRVPSYHRIRHIVEAGIISDLQLALNNDAIATAVDAEDLSKWALEMGRLDEDRLRTIERERKITMELRKEEKVVEKRKAENDGDRKKKKDGSGSNGSRNPSQAPLSSSSTTGRCPPLTEDECTLLRENSGCYKCRQVFVEHNFKDCPNSFPSGTNYKPVTARLVALKKPKSSLSTSTNTVVAVMPQVEDSNDSGSEDDVSGPHRSDHLYWDCLVEGPLTAMLIKALIDNGSGLALIDETVVLKLGLKKRLLHKPVNVSLAMSESMNAPTPSSQLTEYVKLPLVSPDQAWTARTVCAIVAPNLCAPIILGLLWLDKNNIVIDHRERTAIDKGCNYNILNPPAPKSTPKPKAKLRDKLRATRMDHKAMAKELEMVYTVRRLKLLQSGAFEKVKKVDVVASVRGRIEVLAHWEILQKRGDKVRKDYSRLFETMPHVDDPPTNVLCEITVKDTDKSFKTRTYQSPRKYCDAWQKLIQTHLDAGRIRPSSSPYVSPAFLIPKADKTALPRW
ncbi:hypothetical protein DFH09DRAFT_1330969 [Mycena vulgaris]|nr:hypothetical protein DFH09DRAFT_1330969 [Mycena vulgaris]